MLKTMLATVPFLLFSAIVDSGPEDPLGRARALLREHPVIDGHNDLPWTIRGETGPPGDLESYDLRESTRGDTDLARLRAGGVGGQFWSVYVPASLPEGAARVQLEQIELTRATLRVLDAW